MSGPEAANPVVKVLFSDQDLAADSMIGKGSCRVIDAVPEPPHRGRAIDCQGPEIQVSRRERAL